MYTAGQCLRAATNSLCVPYPGSHSQIANKCCHMPRSNIGPETHEFVEWLDIIQGRIDFILNGQGQLRSQGQNRFCELLCRRVSRRKLRCGLSNSLNYSNYGRTTDSFNKIYRDQTPEKSSQTITR